MASYEQEHGLLNAARHAAAQHAEAAAAAASASSTRTTSTAAAAAATVRQDGDSTTTTAGSSSTSADPASGVASILESSEGMTQFLEVLRTMLVELGSEDESSGGRPPASVEWLANLDIVYPTTSEIEVEEKKCPICMVSFAKGDECAELPCEHLFHMETCITPWLRKSNACPICRAEVPTDDPAYEAKRTEAARAEEREAALEKLHDGMFG